MSSGFGSEPFGSAPWGYADWPIDVLWNELPSRIKQQDLDAGGWYYKFVTSLLPPMDALQQYIYKSRDLIVDPRRARADMLGYIAENFGIIPDLEEPEDYQRTKIEIVGRWRAIKGTEDAYKVLCAVHGFNVTVRDIWKSPTGYTVIKPKIFSENLFSHPVTSGKLKYAPVKPGSVRIECESYVLTDDFDGNLTGDGTGTIDYSYGHIDVYFSPSPSSGSVVSVNYDPIEGGCNSRCLTHHIRLDITPGTITGSAEFSILDALTRLFEKIRRDVMPIHVDLLVERSEEYCVLSIGHRFDIIEGDTEPLDEEGIRVVCDDTSW